MYIGLHITCTLFLSDFHENCILSTDFRKIVKFNFHENPSGGRQGLPYGEMGKRRETDQTGRG